ncbi:MAG TPA: XRE family transcriptional regulator [Thermodesulfobacteriota bacterium]|jgi:DNA-binding transcriptional regulator YdaS (Cro superfamily)|nr:XRE family transcriptional regulator [Thermodesulfobacteriota bacterium]
MNLKLKFRIIELFGNQVNFAQKVGVQESLVSRVVKGRRSLSVSEQAKWAEILRLQAEDLFGEDATRLSANDNNPF